MFTGLVIVGGASLTLFLLLKLRHRFAEARRSSGPAPVSRVRRSLGAAMTVGTGAALLVLSGVVWTTSASAAQPPVGLGTATSYAVLAGTTVTNIGPSVISGDLGVYPGTAVTGFPPGTVINGTTHAGDAAAAQAQSDLTTGYNDAAGRTPATAVPASGDVGGLTLTPGVYNAASAMSLTGTVTLNGQSNPNAVFIFQAGSTLITASSSTVQLIGGAQACNVFWQVGSSATLGTNTTFVGSILALTSATVQTGTTVAGRVLARNGQVSL
ncbi:MAG: ice-binding family protein, partial [Acidimicrobiales bacterium]